MAATDAPDEPEAADIRPAVARRAGSRGGWLLAAALALGSLGLFSALDARRTQVTSPAIAVPPEGTGQVIAPPPALVVPAPAPGHDWAGDYGYGERFAEPAPEPRQGPIAAAPSPPRYAAVSPPPMPAYSGPSAADVPPAAPSPGFAYQAPAPRPSPPDGKGGARTDDTPAKAGRLANPATTVPQGTVIQAVMETALDSTRPGFARAIVSRDVSSFDGSQVLIPRGSKLFGEYKADLAHGQNRAVIQWHRLTRPDGSLIDVDSPSADPLGRAGLTGKVNSHFFERFGGTILQSVLDIGVQTASRRIAGDAVILTLPTSQDSPVVQRPEDIRPTLKVRQGASVSVFVGRDLDFTVVEQ